MAVVLLVFALTGVASAASVAPMTYHGGRVQHVPKVYLVFHGWGAPFSPALADPDGEADYVIRLFSGIGGSPWANVLTEYSDKTGSITNPSSVLAGIWWDNSTDLIPGRASSQEAARGADHFGFDADADYFVLLPHGHPELSTESTSAVAWHGAVAYPGNRMLAYTVFPYVTDKEAKAGPIGLGCPSSSPQSCIIGMAASHEYAEVVTDPLLSAWHDGGGSEIGDKCTSVRQQVTLSTGTFTLTGLWSNRAGGCVTSA